MAWTGSRASIAAIVALDTTDYPDGIAFWAAAEMKWLGLNKTSADTVNSKTCWTATGGGRWFIDSTATVIANTTPVGGAATGTRWLYQENNAVNSYDSVISYVYNGTTWIEIDARIRTYAGTPDYVEFYDPIEDLWDSTAKTPNSDREQWIDTTTGTVYTAFSGGWVAGAGVS